jgi:acyl-coenzyme A thioesterase PaaI-like protein
MAVNAGPDINQPGGGFVAIDHPAISGRERELRHMADQVRRLIESTMTHTATATETATWAAKLETMADEIDGHVPTETPPRHFRTMLADSHVRGIMPFDVMAGSYNPIALPIRLEWDDPVARGHAHFTAPYEGPPQCVHGAVIAGSFDQVLNMANLMGGRPGMTSELSIDYKKPTPLTADLVFEAQVHSIEGRRITTRGTLRHGDTVTATAAGLFVDLGDRMRSPLDD